MRLRLLVRFGLVLGGGLLLVWIFGIHSGENLLGTKKVRVKVDEKEKERLQQQGRSDEADLALRDGIIPVREVPEDAPGTQVLRYVIYIGYTASGNSKKMLADDVRVDIYNRKPRPDERVMAMVRGDDAIIHFLTAPDAAAGFQDAAIDSMTLMKNVAVEYLDETGHPVTTMTGDELELDLKNRNFHVPGHAVIVQEGLKVEGDELTYQKDPGSFAFERNVTVTGTRFGMPETSKSEKANEGAPAAEEVPKTITCDGRFTFIPAERVGTASGAEGPGAIGGIANMDGGVLTFRDNVVGTQGETRIRCDELEISLDSRAEADSDAPDGKGNSKLVVSRVIATGRPTAPAVLNHPQGTLEGETLTLLETDDGQVITLLGEPRIKDARVGGSNPEGEGEATPLVFQAGAQKHIRFRPAPAEEIAEGTESPAEMIFLELEGAAYLETRSDKPEEDFRLDGHRLDLDFLKQQEVTAEGETSRLELQKLVCTGEATGDFAGGTFRGDRIVALPQEGSADASQFEIHVSPNPSVELTSDTEEGSGQRVIKIHSDAGLLTYLPPATKEEQTRATFTGPTTLDVWEDAELTTTMTAQESVTILLGRAGEAGGSALSSMTAKGDVVLENRQQGVNGTGGSLTLTPTEDGGQRIRLSGTPEKPAVAHADGEDCERRDVSALDIDFDPEASTLHALGQVEASFTGLDLAGDLGPDASTESAEPTKDGPGLLHCEDLLIRMPKDGGKAVVEARTNVVFDDPSQNLLATCDFLEYDETLGLAILRGARLDPAVVTRSSNPEDETRAPDTLSIAAPRLDLEQEIGTLTAPAEGVVTMIRPGDGKSKSQRVVARSSGPIRYFEDRLVLRDDVVVGFEEDQREQRALWCDVATVFFSDKIRDEGEELGVGKSAGGFDKLIAEGRVHLEQIAPRDLIAEGQRLEWLAGDEDEVLLLSGTNPQCWVVGLLGDKDVRDEADWFRLYKNSEEVQAENGRTVFIQQISKR